MRTMKDKVFGFLLNKQVKLCALATATKDDQPWNAIMGYAVQEDLTIVLSTHKGSKKYNNLQQNSKVALVFGWEFSGLNVQCEGEARIIEAGEEYKKTEKFFFTQNPHAAKFKNSDTIFIKITPKWIRVTDFNTQPPSVKEQIL